MDVKELKKRWIRGLICPPLFYLPVKQTEYKDIIIKCIYNGQEYPLITSISIDPYNMTPQYEYQNLVYNEQTSSYESNKYYDPFTKQYFDTLSEAMTSYYQHRVYTWIDEQGRTQVGYMEANIAYSEDKTFKDENELRYPTIEWEKYSTIVNFIENPVEVIANGDFTEQSNPSYYYADFNNLQSYIIIRNLKPGTYQIGVYASSEQSDYPIDERKGFNGVELIQPEDWNEEYSGTFYDETGYEHTYSPYGSNYYNISSNGTINRLGWHNGEYTYTKYSGGYWSNSRKVADEFFGTKAPYKDNTLTYELQWYWITYQAYFKIYYKNPIINDYYVPYFGNNGQYLSIDNAQYPPENKNRYFYNSTVSEYSGIFQFKNLTYSEDPIEQSNIGFQYRNQLYVSKSLKIGEYSYEVIQMPVFIKNYWGDTILYYKLDSISGNDKITITKQGSSNPQNNPISLYFSPKNEIKIIYCQIDNKSTYKIYIDNQYKGYFQVGTLYGIKDGNLYSAYSGSRILGEFPLEAVGKYDKQNKEGKYYLSYFVFPNEEIPTETDYSYHDIRTYDSLYVSFINQEEGFDQGGFAPENSCKKTYENWPNVTTVKYYCLWFYGVPIMMYYQTRYSSNSGTLCTDWTDWNCYNDTNGINYNNHNCQIYYYLGDGLTKEILGLVFSGYNKIIRGEDE